MASNLRTLARSAPRLAPTPTSRHLHSTSSLRLPYKDSQERDSLRPQRAEGTSSGRDDDAAQNADAAFNPSKTRPESAAESAKLSAATALGRGESGTNPLEVSGANQEMSKPRGDETADQTGKGQELSKGGASKSRSSPKKADPKKYW